MLLTSFRETGLGRQKPFVFLDQTRKVGGQLEWNREIIAANAGELNIKVVLKEKGKFSVLIMRDEDYQVVIGKRPEPKGFKPELLINVDTADTYETRIKLAKGTYWIIVGNQEAHEIEIHLICSDVR